ncbi:hypothetical protein [Devosia pacifica]|uniref:hypothetical protein n=1 Tax=Devosia pacifica TaxID=1335967 RepID=UPI001678D3D9|nr:hypothetical protein [Devosia pacifica]
METALREHLLSLARQYADAAGVGISTVGRRCRRDSSFFTRIADADSSFTARTFDEVVAWFDANWPDGTVKPDFALQPEAVSA